MVTEQTRWAPYGPPATVLEVIKHFRERDVPEQIDRTRLTQIGVSDGLMNKVWATLEFLGLITEDGTTLEAFRKLRYASSDEYEEAFKEILNNAYSDILEVVDPTTADSAALDKVFRPYSPGGQRTRMITLFLGLCREAGITTQVQRNERSTQASTGDRRRQRKQVSEPADDKGQKKETLQPNPLREVQRQYAELLLDKVKAGGGDQSEIMDRLERVLGVGGEGNSE